MMKKFIAVLAVSAIATTAAWAQISFEGMVMGRADLGNNFWTNHGPGGGLGQWDELNPDLDGIHARRNFTQEARLFMNMVNADGTAGATARFWNTGWHAHHGWNNAPPAVHMWAWWRPMENLLLQIGENPWGFFGTNQIVAGAFTGNESENSLLGPGSAGAFHYGGTFRAPYGVLQAELGNTPSLHRNTGFYGGFGHPGITAAFEAIDGLTILLGLPFAMGNAHGATPGGGDPANFFVTTEGWVAGMLRSHVGVRFAIEEIGTLAFTWAGGAGYWGGNESPGPLEPLVVGNSLNSRANFGWANTGTGTGRFANSSKFYLSFLLSALEEMGMQVNLGVAYTLPFSRDDGYTFQFPVELGLGFRFDAGDLALRARLAAMFAGTTENPAGYNNNAPFILGLNVHPSFNLGTLVANLNAGLQLTMNMNDDRGISGVFFLNDSDTIVGWHVSPYITVPVMNATVFAGLHIESCGMQIFGSYNDSMLVRWRVPVGLRLNF